MTKINEAIEIDVIELKGRKCYLRLYTIIIFLRKTNQSVFTNKKMVNVFHIVTMVMHIIVLSYLQPLDMKGHNWYIRPQFYSGTIFKKVVCGRYDLLYFLIMFSLPL